MTHEKGSKGMEHGTPRQLPDSSGSSGGGSDAADSLKKSATELIEWMDSGACDGTGVVKWAALREAVSGADVSSSQNPGDSLEKEAHLANTREGPMGLHDDAPIEKHWQCPQCGERRETAAQVYANVFCICGTEMGIVEPQIIRPIPPQSREDKLRAALESYVALHGMSVVAKEALEAQ